MGLFSLPSLNWEIVNEKENQHCEKEFFFFRINLRDDDQRRVGGGGETRRSGFLFVIKNRKLQCFNKKQDKKDCVILVYLIKSFREINDKNSVHEKKKKISDHTQ